MVATRATVRHCIVGNQDDSRNQCREAEHHPCNVTQLLAANHLIELVRKSDEQVVNVEDKANEVAIVVIDLGRGSATVAKPCSCSSTSFFPPSQSRKHTWYERAHTWFCVWFRHRNAMEPSFSQTSCCQWLPPATSFSLATIQSLGAWAIAILRRTTTAPSRPL